MATMPPAEISSGREIGSTLGQAGLQLITPHRVWHFSGMNMIGSQPSAISAVAATLRPMSEAHQIGMSVAHRVVDELQRLAEAGALACRQRHLARSGRRRRTSLALPDHAADLDVLLDALHRLLVGHAVEALDDLRPGGAETEMNRPSLT